MTVKNLGSVSKIIQRLFDLTVDPAWETSLLPPDFEHTTKRLHIHLYHVREDAHRKNFPPPFERPPDASGGPTPVSLTPLGLSLYYVVIPIQKVVDDESGGLLAENTEIFDRHAALGQAAKAIHDYPVIDDDTMVGTTQVLTPALQDEFIGDGERLELILRPLSPEDAVTFWSSEETQTPQASLYLEARVALLPPEEPTVVTGIVLTVGNYIFVGFPQLVGTRNTITVTLPDSSTTTLQAAPARVSIFSDGGGPTPPTNDNNLLFIEGANISSRVRKLILSGPSGTRVTIKLDDNLLNGDWMPMFTSTGMSVRVRQNPVDDDTSQPVPLVPGAYTARILIEDEESGQSRTSNSVPLTLAPEIAVPVEDAMGPSTTYTTVVQAGVIPSVDSSTIEDHRSVVQLAVGGKVLTWIPSGSPSVDEWMHSGGTITFRIDAPDEPAPTILFINGVASPVVWAPEVAP